MPTLLDLCEVAAPKEVAFDGRSIKPLLFGAGDSWGERFVVSDSQRLVDPKKWRKCAVMSDNWRLVNGEELYEIKKDPGQANNVAADYPEKVAEMRAFYEAWWADIEPSFSQTTEIHIGAPEVPVVDLNAHDWITDEVPLFHGGNVISV